MSTHSLAGKLNPNSLHSCIRALVLRDQRLVLNPGRTEGLSNRFKYSAVAQVQVKVAQADTERVSHSPIVHYMSLL
ncbi:UNVERIFIED_CONTAM: hypothetical protein FKN15_042315 [Acipenser sinensis]